VVDPTPPAWRAAALTILFGGAGLGYRAATGRGAPRLVVGTVVAGLGAAVPIAVASRRPPIPTRADAALHGPDGAAGRTVAPATPPTFTVVVAARDEVAVLPRLIGDVAAQDHRTADGRPLFELILIDDRSVDGTPQAGLRAAAVSGIGEVTRLVRRSGDGLPDGKGAALTALDPDAYRGEVVVVLDADARVAPHFLSTLAHYIGNGAQALTARRRILDAGSFALAGAQADEQTVDGELQRGRWAMGGLSEFRGNGIVVRRDLLIAVGGWRAEALTEDLDLSSRVAAARGTGVAWALDAEVWEEPVRSWPALWRQRVRWAEGAVRRLLEHGRTVLASPAPAPAAKLDFLAYAGQLVAPPLVVGAVAGAVVRGRPGTAAALLGAYGLTGGALSWDSLRWERAADGGPLRPAERARRAVRAAAFGGIWLAAVPAALWRLATRRGALTYDKMEHDGRSTGDAGGGESAGDADAGGGEVVPAVGGSALTAAR
jgi:1,2-diacylglycerol 3-beta-glucosyltransferase